MEKVKNGKFLTKYIIYPTDSEVMEMKSYVFPTLIDVIPLPWAGEDYWALLEGAGEVGRAAAHTRLDKKGRLG